MAFEENSSNMYMPVAPAYGGNGSFGMGGDWGWIILFLIFGMFGNGWGNGSGSNGLYPWLNQSNQVNDGFRDQMMNTTLNGIQASVTNGFGAAEVAACNRAMMDMERSFAAQTANTEAMFGLQSQLAQCCCDNRLATANLSALVQSENCADREALNTGIRDIIANQTAGTQRIIDMMCQDKIDAKNERIAELQNQLTMANLAASQNAQTAAILANNEAQTAALEKYLAPNPVPAYVVQNPNCCGVTNCGCSF